MIYINRTDASNKFWSYEPQGNNVLVKWGRVGTTGQSKLHTFGSTHERDRYINNIVSEKEDKGYKVVTEEKLNEESETAKTLGIQWKINRTEWVEKYDKGLQIIPKYNQQVYIEVLNSWTKERLHFLMNKTDSLELANVVEKSGAITFGRAQSAASELVGAIREYLRRLSRKVQEVVISKFGAMGVRKLDLGEEDEETFISQPGFKDVIASVSGSDSGASVQVLTKFASLGNRVLDL
jgi:predicted DNA-binding WGR domain protein